MDLDSLKLKTIEPELTKILEQFLSSCASKWARATICLSTTWSSLGTFFVKTPYSITSAADTARKREHPREVEISMLSVRLTLAAVAALVPMMLEGSYGLPMTGDEAEAFLRDARIVSMKPIGVGITKPMKVSLSDGVRTHHAVWKSVNEVRLGVVKGRNGGFQMAFKDSYKYEVAAYELDKMLGFDLVPPTVEREIDGKRGSLQLWVEGAFTELDRREKNLESYDHVSWSNQQYKLRLLQQLTYNDDAQNIRNVIYDPSFRVYCIDNSRSFRHFHSLADERGLRRFSRSAIVSLKALDAPTLKAKLGAWLDDIEMKAILARRDLLVALATTLAADLGDDAIYYP